MGQEFGSSRRRGLSAERWLPLAAAAAWWVAMYPGLFGEDSLITLNEARSGPVGVWFTAWWIFVIDALSLGTRAIPLLTLAGVLILTWSITVWAAAALPGGAARAWSVILICATPLVGALGVQVRHDAWMTAGLLLCIAVITRTQQCNRVEAQDYLHLVIAALLIPTRHNGLATVVVAGLACAWLLRPRMRIAIMCAAVAIGVAAVTAGATRAAGQARWADPVQVVEWVMADISCLLSERRLEPTDGEWAVLDPIAGRDDWQQPVACRFVSPLLIAPTFKPHVVQAQPGALVRTWLSMASREPAEMAFVHFRRVSMFLPPLITGLPDYQSSPFLHSTILSNDFGLAWAFPPLAETARLPIRVWNALRVVLANTALWLLALALVIWKRTDLRPGLVPTLIFGIVLNLGLLATAPISEGRYGLLILVTGQLTTVYLLLDRRSRR